MRKGPRTLTHAHSDSEADSSGHFYALVNNLPPVPEDHGFRYDRLNSLDGNQTDDMDEDGKKTESTRGRSFSLDEFGDHQDPASRLVRTGRQRKKNAARSKGGEFRTKRKKRRVYFCCASSEIDVQKLFDYLVGAGSLLNGWKYQLHADVLHLYKPGFEDRNSHLPAPPIALEWSDNIVIPGDPLQDILPTANGDGDRNGGKTEIHSRNTDALSSNNVRFADGTGPANASNGNNGESWSDNSRISGIGAQEVFVFDFGAAVFWVSTAFNSNLRAILRYN